MLGELCGVLLTLTASLDTCYSKGICGWISTSTVDSSTSGFRDLLKSSLLWCRVDGEAMVHAVMLADGEVVSYCNHWLKTPRFLHEEHAGQNIYPRVRAHHTFPFFTLQ